MHGDTTYITINIAEEMTPSLSVCCACAKLWTTKPSQEGVPNNEIVSCLRDLHEALLQDTVSSYDPSDVFLAIQAAVLRFFQNVEQQIQQDVKQQQRQQQQQQQQQQNQHDGNHHDDNDNSSNNNHYEVLWCILQESMWTVAALCRACVAPAWWYQTLHRRRRIRNNHNNDLLPVHHQQSITTAFPHVHVHDKDKHNEDSSSSINNNNIEISSSTASRDKIHNESNSSTHYSRHGRAKPAITAARQLSTNNIIGRFPSLWFPRIPEVLPAAILRFAAQATDRSMQLEEQLGSTIATSNNSAEATTEIGITVSQKMNLIEAQLFVAQQLCCAHHGAAIHSIQDYDDYDYEGNNTIINEWCIPGAHEAVGNILSHGLKFVCTGQSILKDKINNIRNNNHSVVNIISQAGMLSCLEHDNAQQDQQQEEELQSPTVESSSPPPTPYTSSSTPFTTTASTSSAKDRVRSSLPVSKDQWKHVFLVTRAAPDFLLAGWRPLPGRYDGDDVVLALMAIACIGSKLEDLDLSSDQNAGCVIREERLWASCCVCKALSGLVCFANQGLIPCRLQSPVVKTIISLQRILGPSIKSIRCFLSDDILLDVTDASTSEEGEGCQKQIELLVSTLESCHMATSTLIWAMLSNESSLERTINDFFLAIDDAIKIIEEKDTLISPLLNNNLKWNDHTDSYVLVDCAIVLRLLSSALWGAGRAEVPSLCIFWTASIQAICKVLAVLYASFIQEKKETKKSGKVAVDESNLTACDYFSKQVQPIVLEAVAALERAINVELKCGSTVLSAVDWDAIVHGFQVAVIPWLVFCGDKSSGEAAIRDQIRTGLESMLLRVAELLANYLQNDSAPLLDYSVLRVFLLSVIRHSFYIGEKHSEVVDTSVVQAWVRFGFFPYRLDGWSRTAKELIREAFARREDGGFRHSILVRLEALKLLTFEETEAETDEGDASTLKPQSLMNMTQYYMCDVYNDIVSNSLLPVLENILVFSRTDEEANNARQELCEMTVELQMYAIKLVGRMFCSVSGEHRSQLVDMLKCAAVSSPWSNNGEASVRFEALCQLESCLDSIFCQIPQGHQCITQIVDSVCMAWTAAVAKLLEGNAGATFKEASVVATNSLQVLGRLQLNPRRKLALLFYPSGAKYGDKQFVEKRNSTELLSCKVLVASFVTVCNGCHPDNCSSEKSFFSFKRVTEEILEGLERLSLKRATAAFSLLRTSCFDLLSKLLISGVPFMMGSNCQRKVLSVKNIAVETESGEILSMIKASSLSMQRAFAMNDLHLVKGLELVPFVESTRKYNTELATRAWRSLFYIIVFAEEDEEITVTDKVFGILLDRLKKMSPNFSVKSPDAQFVSSLLALTMEAISRREGRLLDSFPAMSLFKSCLCIISKSLVESRSLALHLALRCIVKISREFTHAERDRARQLLSFFCEEMDLVEVCDSYYDGVEDTFSPSIIKEAVEQQAAALSETSEKDPLSSSLSRHERSSIQSERIDRFIVEKEQPGKPSPYACWLCENNVILTCRVGSSSSRYSGYIEVILRSPLTLKRSLIPIPGKITLDDPEFPWHGLYAPSQPESSTNQELSSVNSNYCTSAAESSDILDNAQALLDRYDTMFAHEADQYEHDDADYDYDVSYINYIDVDDNSSQNEASQDEEEVLFGAPEESTLHTVNVTLSRDVALLEKFDVLLSAPDSAAIPAEQTFKDWLISVYGWDEEDKNIVHERLEDHLRAHSLHISNSETQSSCFQNYVFREKQQLQSILPLHRAMGILDHTFPSNTYKFGLLYYGHRPGSSEETNRETSLLSTKSCSPSFHKFSAQLGSMISIKHLKYFSAGLDVSEYETDGRFTLAWSEPDGSNNVVFHVANLMPRGLNGRKRHIGNDNVLIVFIDASSDNDEWIHSTSSTQGVPVVSGHFNFATIFVRELPTPEPNGLYLVSCRKRADLPNEVDKVLSDFTGDDLISEDSVGVFVRNLAIRLDLGCRTTINDLPTPTNWLERCRQISEMTRYKM